jgi:polyhydroxyalkanoate synthesis repressor PhaR
MVVIKRYPNRKLYNTESKQYVTLDGIADLIRRGGEVQIVDHSSGEDLTAITLTQIISEQEKKQGGFLPRSVLTGLVQSGGQTLASLRRTLASPLDLLAHVDQEIERRLQGLVELGDLTEVQARQLKEKLWAAGPRGREALASPSEAQIEEALARRGVPRGDELSRLNQRLDELMARLEEIQAPEPAAKP